MGGRGGGGGAYYMTAGIYHYMTGLDSSWYNTRQLQYCVHCTLMVPKLNTFINGNIC